MARRIKNYPSRILRGPTWDNRQDHVAKVANMDTIIILLILAYCSTYLIDHRWWL